MLIVILIGIAGLLCACGGGATPQSAPTSSSSSSGGLNSAPPTTTVPSTESGSPPPPSPASSSDDGSGSPTSPFDFELNQQFTSFQSSDDLTQSQEENAYEHVLFMVDPGGSSSVIDGNLSASAVPLDVTVNSDGSLTIGYSEQTSSASLQFTGTLDNGTVTAQVSISTYGGNVVDGTEYFGAGTGTVTFTAPVSVVSADDLPAPPTGGSCAYSSDDGVEASWTPPSQGPAVSSYDVYQVNSNTAALVIYLGRVNGPGIDDESQITHLTDADALSYLVYSVGPTGLDGLAPLSLTFLDGTCD
jgi:hypothetical protein